MPPLTTPGGVVVQQRPAVLPCTSTLTMAAPSIHLALDQSPGPGPSETRAISVGVKTRSPSNTRGNKSPITAPSSSTGLFRGTAPGLQGPFRAPAILVVTHSTTLRPLL